MERFIIGRQTEVDQFVALVSGQTPYTWINIYGPGGIGKTVVGQRMQVCAAERRWPVAFIDGIDEGLTPIQILNRVRLGLAANPSLVDTFSRFSQQFENYTVVQEVLQAGGGVNAMFSTTGAPAEPEALSHLLSSLGFPISQEVSRIISNRFSFERYLRAAERELTSSLSSALSTAVDAARQALTILIDTYEEIEGYDDWIYRRLAPALPEGVKVVILGRNALPKVNFDWQELGERLHVMELPELSEPDAKSYLKHYGLQDTVALDQVYRFTGGYPLLLVLAVHLAQEAGGWTHVGSLEYEADRDRVAARLLERILREERVKEVQAFLEKGVLARWFTPEIVSVILEVNAADGRTIYDKLARHSFVERHPFGLKFHDKIRELLLDRLKFSDTAEYERIRQRLSDYYAERAGLNVGAEPEPAALAGPPGEQKRFGELLRYYRRRTNDRERGGRLTQERLAELLSAEPNCPYISNVTISHWENDKIPIAITDRPLLLGLIRVLHRHGGIRSVDEANQLLFAGKYSHLSNDERRDVFGSA
ncbi:MAG: hypothetical protein L0322_18670 [Chloroflexi bacterium]|nr:hypothetical protein [Chloroflexota bacterium]